MDEWQWIINLLLGVILAVLGWFARQLWESVNKLNADLNKLEVQMPTVYVNKDEFRRQIDHSERLNAEQYGRIEKALDKIFDKLDGKVDK